MSRMNQIVFCAAAIASACASVQAQVAIDWYTIDGGGGASSNGCTAITGTIGQWDAASPISSGAASVQPGFWNSSIVPPGCPADLNGDGAVNTFDLTRFLGRFGVPTTACGTGDFNGDGAVNTTDLVFFLGRFGNPCPQ
jgi:hypothetical protein